MSIFNKKTLYGLLAAAMLFGTVAPAAAQRWDRPPPRDGWGAPGPRHYGWAPRRHCWIQERRVRVMTPWGPRWRIRNVRVCR